MPATSAVQRARRGALALVVVLRPIPLPQRACSCIATSPSGAIALCRNIHTRTIVNSNNGCSPARGTRTGECAKCALPWFRAP